GFEVLDVFGPMSPLNMLANTTPNLTMSIISASLDPVSSASINAGAMASNFGQSIVPTHTLASPPQDLDVLFVPGGSGTRANATELQPYFDFIKAQYPTLKYLVSVCTGATMLARAGVLDGRQATTNKFSWEFGTSTGPEVDWVPHARWVVDGNIWTTSGVSAGVDGTFAWIKHLWGEEKTQRIANILEYEREMNSTADPFADIW
ncbi:class I glutamine amidotransferase-like protein, partial [Auriculariales sp. MPI-PUGE-AT-0066]